MLSPHLEMSLQKFTSEDMVAVIKCQDVIGEGCYGKVYKGQGLAIKILHEV